MVSEEKLIERAKTLLEKRGKKALEISKQSILQEKIEDKPLREALRYFMEEVWFDVLHPALLALTCEAVGGNPDSTTGVGAAVVLLAGAADIHDDIIDQSVTKASKPTVFGKFGQDVAILAGDALLFKGLYVLHEALETLPKEKKLQVLALIEHAFLEISGAEARETSLRGRVDLPAGEYCDVIRKKIAAAEAIARIGAILGGGTQEEIDVLGHYSKTLAFLMTLRDEFVDIYEIDELKNRTENECLPVPILFAVKNEKKKDEIIKLLKGRRTKQNDVDRLVELVTHSDEVQALKREMQLMARNEIRNLNSIKNVKTTLRLLLKSATEDL
jgi:geranylgeranyl diphosphate synthase type I